MIREDVCSISSGSTQRARLQRELTSGAAAHPLQQITSDDLIDTILGNRKYVPCLCEPPMILHLPLRIFADEFACPDQTSTTRSTRSRLKKVRPGRVPRFLPLRLR